MNWIKEGFKRVNEEVEKWPEWMKCSISVDKHYKYCTRKISEWPKWKQEALGVDSKQIKIDSLEMENADLRSRVQELEVAYNKAMKAVALLGSMVSGGEYWTPMSEEVVKIAREALGKKGAE